MNTPAASEFQRLYTGRLWSVMSRDQLAAFWQGIDPAAGWYLYSVGNPPEPMCAPPERVSRFITEMDALLRAEHRETYCGIVYADDLNTPRLIKIYDPNNLGSSCGSSKNPPLPGWVMSRVRPEDIASVRIIPEGRRRWWRVLMGDS